MQKHARKLHFIFRVLCFNCRKPDPVSETAITKKYLNDIITSKMQVEPEDVIDYCSYLCSCA